MIWTGCFPFDFFDFLAFRSSGGTKTSGVVSAMIRLGSSESESGAENPKEKPPVSGESERGADSVRVVGL